MSAGAVDARTEPARDDLANADLVLLGPVAPLRGGIAQHGERLAEAALAAGLRVRALSFRRLYPASLFPGRRQRIDAPAPAWSREVLDVLSPASWTGAARLLEATRATVVLEWWHPVTAPAFTVAVRRVPRDRLAAVCHNVLPHEPVPGARAAARHVLGRCGRVVCHGADEAGRLKELLGGGSRTSVASVALPCLVAERTLGAGRPAPELASLPPGARLAVAAGHQRPYKDVPGLVAAWQRAKRPPEARLVLAGESYLSGRARGEVQAATGRDRSIVVVDRYLADEELVYLLQAAEVVVAAHRHASQSGILPLASALGTPCLVSDAGGLAAQVEPSDATPVVPAGDVHALGAALERFFARPAPARRRTTTAAGASAAEWRSVLAAVLGGDPGGH